MGKLRSVARSRLAMSGWQVGRPGRRVAFGLGGHEGCEALAIAWFASALLHSPRCAVRDATAPCVSLRPTSGSARGHRAVSLVMGDLDWRGGRFLGDRVSSLFRQSIPPTVELRASGGAR